MCLAESRHEKETRTERIDGGPVPQVRDVLLLQAEGGEELAVPVRAVLAQRLCGGYNSSTINK
jgi:hypothetical protein